MVAADRADIATRTEELCCTPRWPAITRISVWPLPDRAADPTAQVGQKLPGF